MIVVAIIFWLALALLLYAQAGYPLLLAALARVRPGAPVATTASVATTSGAGAAAPSVSAIIAAHNEQDVIGARVENLRTQEYPHGRLEVIVASDGSSDQTAARARAAGADLVLELPRGGKIRAQDAAVAAAHGEILAFSDANAHWQADALAQLVGAFTADPRTGYVCGEVSFLDSGGDNQEGLYWRYEMWIRRLESRLASVTSGNGAIYATRREAYLHVDPLAGHDLSFPFNMVKRGWRATYLPAARASEKMAPSMQGEFARKRRMARRTWPALWGSGLASPRGYGPLYALMIGSHRILRYGVPFLHLLALGTNIALVVAGAGAVGGRLLYIITLGLQLTLLVAAALPSRLSPRPALIARYYVVTNWALAAGLWDYLRGERSPVWEAVEGTR